MTVIVVAIVSFVFGTYAGIWIEHMCEANKGLCKNELDDESFGA